jgi:hypothetical protein
MTTLRRGPASNIAAAIATSANHPATGGMPPLRLLSPLSGPSIAPRSNFRGRRVAGYRSGERELFGFAWLQENRSLERKSNRGGGRLRHRLRIVRAGGKRERGEHRWITHADRRAGHLRRHQPGQTYSVDFPDTSTGFPTTFGGIADAFVARLNAAGSKFDYHQLPGRAQHRSRIFDRGRFLGQRL